MALVVTLNAVDVTDRVLWEETYFEEAADEGRVGGGLLVLRDLPGTIIPRFGQAVLLKEGATVRWRGIVSPDEKGRDTDVDHVGPRRVVRISLQDENYLFDHASIDGYVRPSETDYARITAAFAAERSSVDRTTFVPNASTVTMDARTYTDQMLRDLSADCAETADKDYWLDRDDKLHYVTPAQAATNVAPFALTDNPSVYASDIFAGGITDFNVGLIRERVDPFAIPLQTRLTLKYGPGSPPASVTVNDIPAQGTYGVLEGPPVYDDRSTSSSTATSRANALLRRMSTPETGYDTTVALPDLSLQAGHYIAVTSSPLNLSAQALKVATMTSRRKGNKDAGYWAVDLALNAPRRFMPRARGFVQTSEHTGIGSPEAWSSATFKFTAGQRPNHHLANDSYGTGRGLQSCGYFEKDLTVQLGNAPYWRWRVKQCTGVISAANPPCATNLPQLTANIYRGTWTSVPSVFDLSVVGIYVGNYTVPLAPPPSSVNFSTNWTYPSSSERAVKVFIRLGGILGLSNPLSPWFQGCTVCEWNENQTNGCNIYAELWNFGDGAGVQDLLIEYAWSPTGVPPGQWIFGAGVIETANGTNTSFTTIAPYVAGSLRVYVDGLAQPFNEVNPSVGTFTLGFAPLPGELVTVDYVVGTGA